MKKWDIKNQLKLKSDTISSDELIQILLENRKITTTEEKAAFLNPSLDTLTPEIVGIDTNNLKKAIQRIEQAIQKKEQIIVFGDYDVDGITSSAILWETFRDLGAVVMPYIPHRMEEGYGLSIKGIANVQSQIPNVKLLITVDNGITAHEAIAFAREQGIDVIITDHHTVGDIVPDAFTIVHTTKLCGAGVSFVLSQEIYSYFNKKNARLEDHLSFAALGTVADLVPLTDGNRAIVTHGLKTLCRTNRPGLRALFQEAACEPSTLGVYHIGHVIAPRLNAAGRLESAMDSLRLLCTTDEKRAWDLAMKLGITNKERQMIMQEGTKHASLKIKEQKKEKNRILFIGDAEYAQGVIGLIAGRLVEEFYRPAIVLWIGETHAKASVRSVSGVNIIEFLRTFTDDFVNIGGHPMAAGFTVEVSKIDLLEKKLYELAEKTITDDVLVRTVKVDCELPSEMISLKTYEALQSLAPFGMGNPEPTFVTRGLLIDDVKSLGKEGKHLRLMFRAKSEEQRANLIEAVGFGMGERRDELKIGQKVDVVYTIDENVWNGNTKLQIKVKDLQLSFVSS